MSANELPSGRASRSDEGSTVAGRHTPTSDSDVAPAPQKRESFDFSFGDNRCFSLPHSSGRVTVSLAITGNHNTTLLLTSAEARKMADALWDGADAADLARAMETRTTPDGRKIITDYAHPPIPVRSMDWSAITEDYDGAPDASCPHGTGATEKEAIADLLQQIQGCAALSKAGA